MLPIQLDLEWMTHEEVIRKLKIGTRQLQKLVRDGELLSRRLSGMSVYSRAQVNNLANHFTLRARVFTGRDDEHQRKSGVLGQHRLAAGRKIRKRARPKKTL